MRIGRQGLQPVLLWVLILAPSERLLAQEMPQLYSGQRVRITIPSARLLTRVATLQSVEAGTITIRTERDTFPVPIDSVRSLERSLGRRSAAPYGVVVGGFIGSTAAVPEARWRW